MNQSTLFRGIYEFEDPSGTLLAAKIPSDGSLDLYDGTVVIIRPNQCCLFIYKGKITELFMDGTHELRTGNLPILTKLANLKLGLKSPLRAELWFFSGQVFTARRWGTSSPVLVPIDGHGVIPIRMFGQYNIVLRDPQKFFLSLVGTRSAFDICDLEEFVQGQIQELAPDSISGIKRMEDLGRSQDKVSTQLEKLLEAKLKPFGLKIIDLQVHSLSPGQEVLKAMETKAAITTIGDQKAYLLYQAAQSLNPSAGAGGSTDARANDPMQMMLGLMLGKNLMGENKGEPKEETRESPPKKNSLDQILKCKKCAANVRASEKFCSNCGNKL